MDVVNITILLQLFSRCINHVTIYSRPDISLTNLHPPNNPIILTTYNIQKVLNCGFWCSSGCRPCYWVSLTPKTQSTSYQLEFNHLDIARISDNYTYDAFNFQARHPASLGCSLELYLFTTSVDFELLLNGAFHTMYLHHHLDSIFPRLFDNDYGFISYSDWNHGYTNMPMLQRARIPKFNRFQIIASKNLDLPKAKVLFDFIIPETDLVSNIPYRMVYDLRKGFIFFQSILTTDLEGKQLNEKNHIDSVTKLVLLLDCKKPTCFPAKQKFVTVSHSSYSEDEMKDACIAHLTNQEYFRKFHKSNWADLVLLQIAFYNFSIKGEDETSKALRSQYSDKSRVAWVTINGQDGIHMVLDFVTLKFITCGGEEAGHFSLFGYISAFDNYCWLLIATVSFASLWVFHKCRHGTLSQNVFVPLRVLLEQGLHHQCSQNSCKYINLVWLVVGVVVSNAYKGENITDLSSPIHSKPVKEFQEILAKNFTVYSPVTEIFSKNTVNYWMDMLVNMSKIFNASLTTENITNMYQSLYEDALQLDTVFDVEIFGSPEANEWNSLIRVMYSFQQVYQILGMGVPEGYLRFIRNCDNTAFVDWSDQIQNSRYILKRLVRENLNNNSVKGSQAKVSISIDGIGEKRTSWGLSWVKLPGERLFKRISSLVESGTARQWRNWEQRVRTYRDMVAAMREPVEFRALQVGDNIVVVFYTHLVALAATVVIYILEIGPTIYKRVTNKIRLFTLIGRFLYEFGTVFYHFRMICVRRIGTLSTKVFSKCFTH